MRQQQLQTAVLSLLLLGLLPVLVVLLLLLFLFLLLLLLLLLQIPSSHRLYSHAPTRICNFSQTEQGHPTQTSEQAFLQRSGYAEPLELPTCP